MFPKYKNTKTKKVGGEREEFDLEIEPIQVHVHRPWKERVVDALVLFAIALAAQAIFAIFMA